MLRFFLFHFLTAFPLSFVIFSLSCGRRGALAYLLLCAAPLLLAVRPLDFAALGDARLAAASASVGALAAALLYAFECCRTKDGESDD